MRNKLNIALLSAATGLLGGSVSHWLIPGTAQAQTAPKMIQTQTFILLNNGGTKVGEFAIDSDGKPNIKLFDDDRVIWSARGARLQSVK
jgi:hypothetical protein